jgi:hypothetical protein
VYVAQPAWQAEVVPQSRVGETENLSAQGR